VAVIVVRHAMPAVERGVAPRRWRLAASAREDCVLLAHALPEMLAPVVYSSDEPKAAETAAIIALRRGLTSAPDGRFREVDRLQVWVEEHRTLATAYLAGEDQPGWEARERVIERFAAGVTDATGDGRDVVIVGHGMALTLWVRSVARIEPVPWWQALTFPEAWRVDPLTGALELLFRGTPG
jgi:broad specificity phosphatase PhoE